MARSKFGLQKKDAGGDVRPCSHDKMAPAMQVISLLDPLGPSAFDPVSSGAGTIVCMCFWPRLVTRATRGYYLGSLPVAEHPVIPDVVTGNLDQDIVHHVRVGPSLHSDRNVVAFPTARMDNVDPAGLSDRWSNTNFIGLSHID